jgi:hypothetical protein
MWGLRRILNFNVAGAILNSVFEDELPMGVEISGYAFFFKVHVGNVNVEALKRIYALDGVLAPPFPLVEGESHALIASYSNDLVDAKLKVHQVRRRLIDIISEVNG